MTSIRRCIVWYYLVMDKRTAAAHVNTSYSIFFLLSAIGFGLIFSGGYGEFSNRAWFVMFGYALLIYFIWDLIKQMYSAGQSVLLYFITFILLPTLLSYVVGSSFFVAGTIIFILSTITAGLLEILFELVFKSIVPKSIVKRLLLVDGKIDKSLVELNLKYESHFNFRSILIAVLIITAYCALSLAILLKS